MTTIGYGDRGPQTEGEIQFVIFAEVFGLCFFALLLTQIVMVAEVMGAAEQTFKDSKNNILQFLKYLLRHKHPSFPSSLGLFFVTYKSAGAGTITWTRSSSTAACAT